MNDQHNEKNDLMEGEPKETNWFSSYCTTSIHIMSKGIKKIKSIFNTQPDFNNPRPQYGKLERGSAEAVKSSWHRNVEA